MRNVRAAGIIVKTLALLKCILNCVSAVLIMLMATAKKGYTLNE
jgi:hypothetical protein